VCACFVAVCSPARRDHDASDQDAFVYRVAHSRAMDASTTAESLEEDDSTVGRTMKIHEWALIGGCSLPCAADCSVDYIDA
jgi:hypothetical protein